MTYSGDNYPGHPNHANQAPVAISPIGRSVNDLAYVLNEQDDIMKKLHDRVARMLSPIQPPPACPPAEDVPKSPFRNDIDGQAARVRNTNRALNELLDRLES
jgi:hypothetical protein